MSQPAGSNWSSVEREELVRRFSAAWEKESAPAIDDFLPTETDRRLDVLVDLIHIDMEQRLTRGDVVSVDAYLARYPELSNRHSLVADLIADQNQLRQRHDSTLIVPRANDPSEDESETPRQPPDTSRQGRQVPLNLNCPHCHAPVQVVSDELGEEVLCPSCGSAFRIDRDETRKWNRQKLPQLGKFELLEAVGRGGFGTVYRARDTQLQRIVAVKVPRSGQLTTDEDEDRFVREARNAAQLKHPGIVPVFEVGRGDTFPYIVSEFVEGVTLADALSGGKMGFRESARLVVKVAEALEHAHSQGVVHRDLKPSNIMMMDDGTPRVMDFGLAKRDAGEVTMTVEGQVLGTPAYMSPEQASGLAHHVDGRSDIYSLGGILFELLTGELPFRGNQRMILHQVLHDEPRAPRTLNDRIPRDLETICQKAMAKEPPQRYQTAQAMADDLNCFLAGEPITARPVGRAERAWRWCKRNPAVAALSTLVVVVLLTGTTVSTLFSFQARARAREALAEKARADDKAAEAQASARRAAQQEANAIAEAQRATREAEVANAATEFITSIFQTSDSIGLAGVGLRRAGEEADTLTLEEVLRRGSQRIQTELKDQPLLQARLMNTVGNINRSLGLYQEAETLLRESLAIRERQAATGASDSDKLALAESQFNLAWLLHDRGSYREAQSLYQKALATRRALLGPQDPTTLTTLFNLAWVMADFQQAAAATELFREVVRARRKVLPAGHRDTLLAEIGLAAVLWSEGKETEILKETLPSVGTDVLLKTLTLYELARMQRRMGRFELATRSYQMIVDTAREKLPAQHPVLAAILVDMAGLLKEKGDYPAAENAMREAIQIVHGVMGGHPKLIPPLVTFAEQLVARGDFDEALRWHREALRISRQSRFDNYTEHVNLLRGVAHDLRSAGQCTASADALREALKIAPDHALPRMALADTCYESGDWQEAQSHFENLIPRSSGWQLVRARIGLRDCLLELGHFDRARPVAAEIDAMLDPAALGAGELVELFACVGRAEAAAGAARTHLTGERKKLPAGHPRLADEILVLGSYVVRAADSSLGDVPTLATLEGLDTLLDEGEKISRKWLGENHPWVGRVIILKARAAGARGDWQTAARLSGQALESLTARFSGDHTWVLEAKHVLAKDNFRLESLPEAERLLRDVLAVREKQLPPLHVDLFETRLDLAATLLAQGNIGGAKSMVQEMLAELAKVAPDGGRRAARAELVLGMCLTAENQFDEAQRVLVKSQTALSQIYGDSHPRTRHAIQQRAKLYLAWDKPQQAAQMQRLLEQK